MMRSSGLRLPRRTILRLGAGASLLALVPDTAVAASRRNSLAQLQAPSTPSLLIDADGLNALIASRDERLVILDLADWGDYRSGHVTGALHSYWQETIERDYPVYGTVLNQMATGTGSTDENQGKRIAWLRRYGIGPDATVIAYDHGDGRRAARIVWFLHFLGHPAAMALDGGFTAWRERDLPTTTTEPQVRELESDPVVAPQSNFYVATTELQEALLEPGTLLVDIRSDEERHDSIDGQYDLGVIPGSIWLPWTELVRDSAGRFVDDTTANELLAAAGVTADRRIILYGRFGSDANQVWLLLKQLGFPSVEIYDRGWVEWSITPGLSADPLP